MDSEEMKIHNAYCKQKVLLKPLYTRLQETLLNYRSQLNLQKYWDIFSPWFMSLLNKRRLIASWFYKSNIQGLNVQICILKVFPFHSVTMSPDEVMLPYSLWLGDESGEARGHIPGGELKKQLLPLPNQ